MEAQGAVILVEVEVLREVIAILDRKVGVIRIQIRIRVWGDRDLDPDHRDEDDIHLKIAVLCLRGGYRLVGFPHQGEPTTIPRQGGSRTVLHQGEGGIIRRPPREMERILRHQEKRMEMQEASRQGGGGICRYHLPDESARILQKGGHVEARLHETILVDVNIATTLLDVTDLLHVVIGPLRETIHHLVALAMKVLHIVARRQGTCLLVDETIAHRLAVECHLRDG